MTHGIFIFKSTNTKDILHSWGLTFTQNPFLSIPYHLTLISDHLSILLDRWLERQVLGQGKSMAKSWRPAHIAVDVGPFRPTALSTSAEGWTVLRRPAHIAVDVGPFRPAVLSTTAAVGWAVLSGWQLTVTRFIFRYLQSLYAARRNRNANDLYLLVTNSPLLYMLISA